MAINWKIYNDIGAWFLSNKYVAVMYKPLLIGVAVVLGVVVAWAIYVLIVRVRGAI